MSERSTGTLFEPRIFDLSQIDSKLGKFQTDVLDHARIVGRKRRTRVIAWRDHIGCASRHRGTIASQPEPLVEVASGVDVAAPFELQ